MSHNIHPCRRVPPPSVLLRALQITNPHVLPAAEAREESLLLAKQLAAAKADQQKAKGAAGKLSRQLETEQLLRTDAERAAEALKQRLERLLDSSNEVNKQRTDLAEVCVCGGWEGCMVLWRALHMAMLAPGGCSAEVLRAAPRGDGCSHCPQPQHPGWTAARCACFPVTCAATGISAVGC